MFFKCFKHFKCFLWDLWYFSFGLLVTSVLGFQSQGRFPCLHDSPPVSNRFLIFTSGATYADLLAASIAAEPFHQRLIIHSNFLFSWSTIIELIMMHKSFLISVVYFNIQPSISFPCDCFSWTAAGEAI